MVDFAGLPYIDVRVSFNSFVPAELEEELSEKLVNYYINRLIDNPQKHDKAEFEILKRYTGCWKTVSGMEHFHLQDWPEGHLLPCRFLSH